MAKEQAIMYAPQWGNMTVDNVTFQTNNVIGNFDHPPNVPAYHQIINFLMNCPLKMTFTKSPSVLYQNLLRELWCTAIAYDPNPPTDDSVARPLSEFLIKFLVMNGQSFTLDFNTFRSSIGLDYNKGKYVAHPTPKTVLSGNYSSTEQIKSIQQMIAYCLITGLRFISCGLKVLLGSAYTQDKNFRNTPNILSNSNFTKDPSKVTEIELTACMIAVNNQKDLVSPLPLSGKKKKVKSQTVTPTIPKSHGNTTLKLMEGSELSHSVSSGTVPDPQDLKRNIQLVGMGLPLTSSDKGIHKSKPLLKGKTTDPKDSGGNDQPADKGLPSTVSNKGTSKTTPHPEGPLGDKDSEGNKTPYDMEPINPIVANLSGTGAEYKVDETQSTRLRYQTLTENIGKTSFKVYPGLQTLQFTTVVDIQAYLLSEDKLTQESNEEEVFAAGDDMEEETQADEEEHQASVEGYYEENVDHREHTHKLVQETMDSLDKTTTDRVNLLKALNGVTKTLKVVQDAVKDDPALNKKVIEATEAYTKNSTTLAKLLSLVKNFDFQGLKYSVESLHAAALRQDEHLA
ncbi:hypothetical protein Tco_0843580 [Tanacetum coccineum]|uniref:Uncharacterized protein n=1 Tax=Tanacetum coccineum TaxID=301880 RepID=A0ABQ5B5R2_9ASTR